MKSEGVRKGASALPHWWGICPSLSDAPIKLLVVRITYTQIFAVQFNEDCIVSGVHMKIYC